MMLGAGRMPGRITMKLGPFAAQSGPSPGAVAAMFGVPIENVRAAYRRNAEQLREMARKATASGCKVRGYTGEQLQRLAKSAAQKASQ